MATVGVHVSGGSPSIGSIIGSLGSRYEDIIRILKGEGHSQSIHASGSKVHVKGLEVITLPRRNIPDPDPDSVRLRRQLLQKAFGKGAIEDTDDVGGQLKGTFLYFPEVLHFDKIRGNVLELSGISGRNAGPVENHSGSTTTVAFVKEYTPEQKVQYAKLRKLADTWQSWNTVTTNDTVAAKVKDKVLPGDDSPKATNARLSYFTKVYDVLMRRATW